jgi:hypothetical protein
VSQLFTQTCINQTTSWLVRGWSTFGARMNHEHTKIHKIHHGPDLGEVTTFPLIVFYVISHGGCIQMSFCFVIPKLGVPKLLKLGLLAIWRAITSFVDLQLKWGPKQSYSPHLELSNNSGMPPTCMYFRVILDF